MCIAVNWCKRCCVLFVIVFLVHPKLSYGFKLKDITSPDNVEDNKSSKNIRELPPLKKITKIVHVDDDGNEEIIDFIFEKVHKADFAKSKSVYQTISDEIEKEEDVVAEEASEKMAWSFYSLLGLFGFEGQPKVEKEPESNNGIIDWLKTFKNTTNDPKEDVVTVQKQSETNGASEIHWTSYLDRWPFNLFFPFEKSDKSESYGSNEFSAAAKAQFKDATPLSQEDFESLLHKLPNFIINPLEAESVECKKQLHIFHRQLRGHKLWTLQMIDASAKIPAGILRGNVNQFGDFNLCVHTKTVVKLTSDQSTRIKGKYCLTHIEVLLKNEELKVPLYLAQGRGLWNSHLDNPSHFIPRYTIVNWGICIPNACSSTDVLHMLESTVKPYNNTGLIFKIQVSEDDCYVRKKHRAGSLLLSNWKICLTIGLYIFFTSVVIASTIFNYWNVVKKYLTHYLKVILKSSKQNHKPEGDVKNVEPEPEPEPESEPEDVCNEDTENLEQPIIQEILLSFSAKRTLQSLFSTEPDFIKILPFLRVICTALLYVSLKFLLIGHLPLTNRDKLIKTLENPLSIVIRSPLIYFDILLLISGLLSALKMHEEIQQNLRISVIKRIMGNFLRYLPTLYLVLLFQTWILPHLGSGPLWNTLIGQNSKICEQNMWRNFFAVQNVLDFEETCSPMTIQLAVEMQLYLLTPLLIWLYNSNGDVGFMVYGAIHAISVALRFSRTNIDSLSSTIFHGMNLSKFYRTANVSFSSPLHRATAYLVGIGIGLLLKSHYDKLQFPRMASIAGWITAAFGIIWCFWYPSHNMSTEFIYNSTEAATYSSWAPLLLSLAIGWIIFMTHDKKFPFIVEKILLSKPIILLSKISYPIQLVTYSVILFSTAEYKEATQFHVSDLINFREIFVIVTLALLLALLVDLPFRHLRKLLMKCIPADISTDEKIEDDNHQQDKSATNDNVEEEENPVEPSVEEKIEDIWDSEEDKDEINYKSNNILDDKYDRSSPELNWDKTETENVTENWRTESDLDQNDDVPITQNIETKENYNEEEEIEEDEDEQEISEDDEIIRRPESPEPLFRRRQREWNVDED